MAQYDALNRTFLVSDRGWGFYPYALESPFFRIALASCSASRIPMASCQIRSEHLAHKGVPAAVADVRMTLTELGVLQDPETVSRVDMAVDFVTDVALKDWNRNGWVTRARDVRAYWDDHLLTGWTVGLGSPTAFRLYLKSHEIDTRSHKVYLHEFWRAAHWPPGYPVWRAEGQIRRQTLDELGIGTVEELLPHLPGLWHYLTGQWLRYAVASDSDSTRSRWPAHPLWRSLAEVAWQGREELLTRAYKPSGIPRDEYLGRMAISLLTSIMARENVLVPDEGWRMLYAVIKDLCERKAAFLNISREDVLLGKVVEKGRRYFTMNNAGARTPTLDQQYWAAREYRRQSDGL
jgi:hypothetical protein